MSVQLCKVSELKEKYKKTISYFRRRYKPYIPRDEYESCVNLAIAVFLNKFEEKRQISPQYYLALCIKWSCCSFITKEVRYKKAHCELKFENSYTEHDLLDIDRESLLWQKYMDGYSMRELGEKYGISKQAIRKKIVKEIQKLNK